MSRHPAASRHPRKEIEWVPVAVIKRPVSFFEGMGLHFFESHDDLDIYRGTREIELDDLAGHEFVLRHYRGYPEDTTAVYLPFEVTDKEVFARLVSYVLRQWRLPRNAISWHRP